MAAGEQNIPTPNVVANACMSGPARRGGQSLAVGETVILLNPPLPLVGVSIETMRECQQIDSLANGYQSRTQPTFSMGSITPMANPFSAEAAMSSGSVLTKHTLAIDPPDRTWRDTVRWNRCDT